MIIKEDHLDFDDLNIRPRVMSEVDSRSECSVVYDDKMLPLFAAPMDTVVDANKNYYLFKVFGIQAIAPRERDVADIQENFWTALSLHQFIGQFATGERHIYDKVYVCVDIANGHMQQLYDTIKLAKGKYGDKLVIMAGNIANPYTYELLSAAGADYVRVGIGNGAGCLTTLNTGVGYPMASLIDSVYACSCKIAHPAKIVADGGMKNYSDVIKALALGADYVMIGSIFNKALESAGETRREIITRDGGRQIGEVVNQYDDKIRIAFAGGARFYKTFRGMSTKDVQRELGSTTIRTSEGVYRSPMVEYTLEGWVENFKHYLSTAMSYTGKFALKDFIGNVDLIRISDNSIKRVEK